MHDYGVEPASAPAAAVAADQTPASTLDADRPLPTPARYARVFAPVTASRVTTSIPLFPVLALTLFAGVAWLLLTGARDARRRADALSAHVRTLPASALAPLHDHLLDRALAHYSERELREGKTLLEWAVTLRDRLDELAGREHGPLNKARHRSQLLPAAYRLRGYPNPLRVREFNETFKLAGEHHGAEDVAALARTFETVGTRSAAAGSR